MSRPDAVIVGAGIVGAACAEALARDGLRVLVLEAAYAGGATTAAAMGHVVVMDDSPAQLALTAASRRLWEERLGELPADCEDDLSGTLWIAADEAEMALVRSKAALYGTAGVATEILDERGLREAEPSLRAGLVGALRVPGDRVVYPPNAARFFLAGARSRGAEVHEGVRVQALRPGRVVTSQGDVEAGFVVNAAGTWAGELTPGLPVEPRKGHLVISARAPGFLRHQVVELGYLKSAHTLTRESVAFNVQPRKTGQVLVGSSREFVGLDPTINNRICGQMVSRACAFLPGLVRLPAVRTWVGFRPATPDKLPLVGRWDDRLFVAAGHEGLGVTTATGTARLLADLLAGRPPLLDPVPFDPRRSFAAHA